MAAKSNEKGARFERATCVALSRWCTGNVRDDLFWRSAMSGGRATLASRRGKKLKAHAGDIVATDPVGAALIATFFVECKHHGTLEHQRWIYNKKTPLDEYWDKPLDEARGHEKEPLVIAKQSRQQPIVLATQVGFEMWNEAAKGRLPLHCTFYRDPEPFYCWMFHDMITRCTYTRLQAAIIDRGRVRL